MRTHAELLAYQATLPPEREYFLVMERPVGSCTWTFSKIATEEKSANQAAIDIALERKTCTRIVKGILPRMPDTGGNYATMSDGDTTFMVAE